ncbi:MAG: hypothetical protein ACKOAV_06040, partial [Bacteroidota bacterium]
MTNSVFDGPFVLAGIGSGKGGFKAQGKVYRLVFRKGFAVIEGSGFNYSCFSFGFDLFYYMFLIISLTSSAKSSNSSDISSSSAIVVKSSTFFSRTAFS